MVNTSSKPSKISIEFFDENGGRLFKTQSFELPGRGSKIFKLNSIKELSAREAKHGLFVIECNPGIRGEFRYRAEEGYLRATTPLREGLPPFLAEGKTIFISYGMRPENKDLYDLVSRFVKALQFKVLSALESGRSDMSPGTQIKDMITIADSLIAILTRDEKTDSSKDQFIPSLNVIDEIGQASNKPVLILVEKGTQVPSNIQTRATYIEFSRDELGMMIVNLLEGFQKAGLF